MADMSVKTESELEELLSRPDEKTAEVMAALDGDLLILGVGGKMGPSLARLARRACDRAGVRKRIIAVARFTNSKLPAELGNNGVETIACDLLDREALVSFPISPTSSSWLPENSAPLAKHT